MTAPGTRRALVFDFGGPILLTPFELRERTERRLGLPAGSLDWHGPFAPEQDAHWQQVLSGQASERDYWAARAAHFSQLAGRLHTTREFISAMYAPETEAALVRGSALELIADARAAKHPIGILSNDLRAFHSEEWVAGLAVLRLVDAVVDGSVEAFLKPDPRIYRLIAERLRVTVSEVVFVDDQPVNVAGAVSVGMAGVLFDPTAPHRAFARARQLLNIKAATSRKTFLGPLTAERI